MTTTLVAFFSLSTLCSLCLSSCDGNWKHALNFHTNAESKVSPCQESPAPGGRPLLPHIGQESREDSSQNLHGVLPTETRSQLQVANTCAWLYISPNLVLHPHAILPRLFHHLLSDPDQDPNSLLGAPHVKHHQGLGHPKKSIASRADDTYCDFAPELTRCRAPALC